MIAMRKKKDWGEAAKAIPEVTIEQGDSGKSSSSPESVDFESENDSGNQKKKRAKTSESENFESGNWDNHQKKRVKTEVSSSEKQKTGIWSSVGSMIVDKLASFTAALNERRRAARKSHPPWKQRLVEEQIMQMKRQQMQQQMALHQQQVQLYEKMMTMMDAVMKKMSTNHH
jgi:hypothetical protein